jgi:hypothetical protein
MTLHPPLKDKMNPRPLSNRKERGKSQKPTKAQALSGLA